jgi:hypothetical protein
MKSKHKKIKIKNRTRKNHSSLVSNDLPKIYGKILSQKEGWIIIHIFGKPYERGFAHGYLLCEPLQKIKDIFELVIQEEFKTTVEEYLRTCQKEIVPIVKNDFPEIYEEIVGMCAGALHKGVFIDPDFLIAWNSVLSMYIYRSKKSKSNKPRCSAFIATGEATKTGEIVMGHNTHSDYLTGQTQNVIQYMTPYQGNPFVMQISAGFVASGTDWFLCSRGIIGCETTISGIKYRPVFGFPFFCRIRMAMQYGKTLDDYIEWMLKNNAGDYACSWLLGDTRTQEIMMLDVGQNETYSVKRTKSGVFWGMNAAMNPEFRKSETIDTTIYKIETSSGSRNLRFQQLLLDEYFGKIDVHIAKKIMQDHYDIFLQKVQMGPRSICRHSEMGEKHSPYGSIDAKVVDSAMAKQMRFLARWGSGCGREFRFSEYLRKYPFYEKWKDKLGDFPKRKWISIKES